MQFFRNPRRLVAIGLLVLSAAACQRTPSAEPSAAPAPASVAARLSEQQAVAIARAALAPFKHELKQTLTGALAEGPTTAVSVCAEVAPQLAKRASSANVAVGRSALRVRNPGNAPRAWLAPLIEELARLPSAEGQHRVVPLGGSRFGYAEAIVLQGPCALCHGKQVAPELAAHIAARYPTDQAMGFEVGELRGVFWAEVSGGHAPL